MLKRKQLLAGVLAGAMGLSLAGCGNAGSTAASGGGATAATGEESVYNILYSSEVTTLNYLTTSNTNEYAVGANVVDCLVEYDSYGKMIPSLAESWSHNDDMTEWTFNIRKGVKWVDKDGKEVADVTANDWVSAAQYVNDANNASGSQYMYDTGSVVHNAQAYYDYTAYLMESENGTKTTNADGEEIAVVEPVEADSIGVKAADDYTLVYTLDQPCPFFLSVLSYTSYMPVYGPFLQEVGSQFGLDNENLLYNGAYILSEFEPQDTHVMVKNPTYWDADNVFIDKIQKKYNPEASSVEATMYKSGEVDLAHVSADLLDSWLADDSTKNLVHASRPDNAFSYFYCFNFDPQFDAEYEPENWKLAVNNENFRQAVMHALDRAKAKTVDEPYNPQSLLSNTVTPANFAVGDGLDYTQYPALAAITAGDSYDAAAATTYRDKAKEELAAAGATFPIKVLMPYNPTTGNWDKECQVVEQQLEGALGSDFIDIIVQAGPETGFLSAVRRSGNYAFLKCNWGADYADPLTWSEPFAAGNNYNFWDTSEDAATAALFTQWSDTVDKAAAIYDDDAARYTAFAEAEALLVEHAIVVPYSISTSEGYIASNINPLEGEYAPYGVALQRYKYQHLYDTSMSIDEFQAAYEEWSAERAKVLADATTESAT
ncbi:MAG: peptide ABC transporter substrate-binding protein [Gemmiger sp.]|nr:peptide ABC transporter substrate-binding protein [Gemmiger sp.]